MSAIHFSPTTHSQRESRTANDGNDKGPKIMEVGSSETASDTADSESQETSTKVCGEQMNGCIDGKMRRR